MKYCFWLNCSYFMHRHDTIDQLINGFLLLLQSENPTELQCWEPLLLKKCLIRSKTASIVSLAPSESKCDPHVSSTYFLFSTCIWKQRNYHAQELLNTVSTASQKPVSHHGKQLLWKPGWSLCFSLNHSLSQLLAPDNKYNFAPPRWLCAPSHSPPGQPGPWCSEELCSSHGS